MVNKMSLTEEQVQKMLEAQEQKFNDKINRANSRSGLNAASVDYNPQTKWTYESDPTVKPKWDKPIKDHAKWMKIFYPSTAEDKAALAGNSDKDLEESCYSDEYLPLYQEFKSKLNSAKLSGNSGLYGSVITQNDFSVLRVEADVSRVLGFQLQDNVLEQAVTVQAAPNLVARYRTWSGFEIEPHVGEGVIVEAKKGNMTETTFAIKKDVGAAAITIEAELTTEGDIFGDHVTWIGKKMRKLRNTKIASALETATQTQNSSDWDAYTSPAHTNDPTVDFQTAINTLNGASNKEYRIDTIVSEPAPRRAFFNNTWVKGIYTPVTPAQNSPRITATPGVEGNPLWYTDFAVETTDSVFVYAKEVIVLFDGPKRQTEIGRPDAEVREYYSRDFNDVFVIDQTGLVELTTVLS